MDEDHLTMLQYIYYHLVCDTTLDQGFSLLIQVQDHL